MSDDRSPPKPPADPFALWREWVTASEHQLNRMFNDMMGTEQFARASGSWVEAWTMFQQSMNEGAQRYFQLVNLPTRNDLADVAERLSAVEERLLRIETLLAQAMGREQAAGPASRPARTRRPPSKRHAADRPASGPGQTPDERLVDAVPAATPSTSGQRAEPA